MKFDTDSFTVKILCLTEYFNNGNFDVYLPVSNYVSNNFTVGIWLKVKSYILGIHIK